MSKRMHDHIPTIAELREDERYLLNPGIYFDEIVMYRWLTLESTDPGAEEIKTWLGHIFVLIDMIKRTNKLGEYSDLDTSETSK